MLWTQTHWQDSPLENIKFPHETPPAEGEAIDIAPGIKWLRLPLPMKLDHVNVYALDDGDGWCIIDTGFYSKRMVATWKKIVTETLGDKPVTRVLITHHHPDHVGMAGWLQTHHQAELVATRTSWLFARMLLLDAQETPPPETIAFYESADMEPRLLRERSTQKPFNYADIVHPMPLGFRRIQEGDTLTIGARTFDVRIGNGHAPEHATLWSRDDNIVIAGDQILPGISPNLGVYATEPEADPVQGWLEACERFADIAREDHFVLPGHKLPFTGLPARMRQLIDNHHHALDRLLDHLETPATASQCFLPLFKRKIGDGEYGLALVESIAHLNHLHQQGKITRTRNDAGAWVYQAA
ncbi:MBL fold metallo-hydrolase [Neptunicoccus sediminis]|uniref:MBL fold metallo-hydrolase n=1 Tax=Neptunicoccus sediminis TaxID=1892596 RepID=UPI000845F9F0|nr:MBL fold metallo-hydrolase [Neptunicoccus sediminis]